MAPGADATAPDGFDLLAVTDSTAAAATVVEVTVVVPVADVMVIGSDTVTCDVAPTSTMWCRPGSVSAGMVTVPATAPDESAGRVANWTTIECSSTLTDSPGANPAPVTVTAWPGTTVVGKSRRLDHKRESTYRWVDLVEGQHL